MGYKGMGCKDRSVLVGKRMSVRWQGEREDAGVEWWAAWG